MIVSLDYDSIALQLSSRFRLILILFFLMPILGQSQTYCHLVIHFEKDAPDMTKFLVIDTPYHSDTLTVNYAKLPVDETGEYVWDGDFIVSKTRVRKSKLNINIYFLNEYKLAIDKSTVSIPRKELIGNETKKNEPPGIFVK